METTMHQDPLSPLSEKIEPKPKRKEISIEQLIKFSKIDEKTAKFIEHNDSTIKKNKNQKSKSVVLVEFNGWQPFHISNSYLANILAEKYQSKMVAFENFRIFNKKSYFNIIENS